ncbi:hypothetical protein BDL97_06G031200 [Sphagnum fallax]|nr:hypothetical protein BDL97_06G031200 [Sphagnum fallax]
MAATKLVMNEADEDMGGDKLSAERISYAREFTAATAEEEEEGEEEDVGAVKATVSNNRLQVLPCLTVGSSSIAADAHHGYRREIVIPASCCVDPGVMELSLITGNLDESYSFVTERKKKASMRTFSEELAWVIEQRFGLQHMQAMIDLPSYPPIPLNEDEQLQTGEMQGGQEADAVVVKCLQQAGIIPATLDFFKLSCTLHINYKSTLELKIGDCVFLRQMSEGPPNVAILKNYQDQSASSLQGTATTTLFTLMMVALDSESKDGAHYLHWILANISNQYLTSSAGLVLWSVFVILCRCWQ